MVEWLAKRMIRDSENVTDKKVRGQYGTLCSIMGIVFNVFLFILKYIFCLFIYYIYNDSDKGFKGT